MMKLILTSISTISFFSFGQIEISHSENPDVVLNGQELRIIVDPSANFNSGTHHTFNIKNVSSENYNLILKKQVVDVCPGTLYALAWKICYQYQAHTQPFFEHTPALLEANEVSSFILSYLPEGQDCCSLFKCTWTNEDTDEVMATVFVRYEHSVGENCSSADVKNNFELDYKIYPNVTSDFVTVELEGASKLSYKFVDVSGRLISEGILLKENDTFQIDVKGMNPGDYVLCLDSDKGILKERIIIE